MRPHSGAGPGKRGPWGHGPWTHRPPRGWHLVVGIHRRLVGLLLLALSLGVGGGWLARAPDGPRPWLLGLAGVGVAWILAWIGTRRIARPVHQLARIARALHQGDLRSRQGLPDESAELGELSRSLRGLAERLEAQLEDQKALMAAVSHELRSPLARARVLVELAREGHQEPDPFDALQEEVDAMDGLVGDLLAAARIDFSAVQPRTLDPVEVARDALRAARLDARLLRAPVEVPRVSADPTLLARALAVLLANGQGHGRGVVTLALTVEGERLRWAVEDQGPGFGPGEVEQAFAPFWRGDGPRPPGEGLGLALVRRIAGVHGGEAGAENRAEGGARCWIALPTG